MFIFKKLQTLSFICKSHSYYFRKLFSNSLQISCFIFKNFTNFAFYLKIIFVKFAKIIFVLFSYIIFKYFANFAFYLKIIFVKFAKIIFVLFA